MDIIKFPGTVTNLDTTKSSSKKMFLGVIEATCPHCKTKARIEPSGMIFKSLDYYCLKCGHSHVITNPAFANTISKK
jgi:exosome complex RNA-binding protein Csl4